MVFKYFVHNSLVLAVKRSPAQNLKATTFTIDIVSVHVPTAYTYKCRNLLLYEHGRLDFGVPFQRQIFFVWSERLLTYAKCIEWIGDLH